MRAKILPIETEGYDEVYRVDLGGAVAFVALHAVIEGQTFGGIRVKTYNSERTALDEALRLARAMSRKVVMAGLPAGGAKTVLMTPEKDRGGVIARLGEFIESLDGRYHCGPDLGFTEADDAVLRTTTSQVASGALGDVTARGVLIAIRAVSDPSTVSVQGLGSVGLALARSLAATGVTVTATDLEPDAEYSDPAQDAIFDVEADVFAPCATGGVLDETTIPRLRCKVVCGGANNPLATDEDADRLRSHGILYVPDFVANAGAVIDGGLRLMNRAGEINATIEGIATRVQTVVNRAREQERSPHHIAVEEADARIAKLRG